MPGYRKNNPKQKKQKQPTNQTDKNAPGFFLKIPGKRMSG